MRRLVVVFILLAASAAFGGPASAGQSTSPQSSEIITVERVLVDARVTDYDGDPILNLGVDDFVVRFDGRKAIVESVIWVPETAAARVIAGVEDEQRPDVVNDEIAPEGRLMVFFIQTDFARNGLRTSGQLKFLPHAEKVIDALEPQDRVAVLSFDSHLKFRLDFSNDKKAIINAVRSAISIDRPGPPPIVANPSLRRRLDAKEMMDAGTSEEALVLLGNALKPIPGPKTMVLMGWGLGVLSMGKVHMTNEYLIARRVLESARVTIFALDTTNVDYHDLELGLKQASADTGGFYAKTHQFPQIAIDRLQRTLAGHYELEVRRPEKLARGAHTIDVAVKKRGAYVLARTTWIDK
jgi:VWFA-related protein